MNCTRCTLFQTATIIRPAGDTGEDEDVQGEKAKQHLHGTKIPPKFYNYFPELYNGGLGKVYSFETSSMKKVLVSILAIIYLSTSMGATVHLHYCMGRLVSWGLADRSGENCDFCGMQKMGPSGQCGVGMKDCCHEESRQIRNDKDQKTGQEFCQVMKGIYRRLRELSSVGIGDEVTVVVAIADRKRWVESFMVGAGCLGKRR